MQKHNGIVAFTIVDEEDDDSDGDGFASESTGAATTSLPDARIHEQR